MGAAATACGATGVPHELVTPFPAFLSAANDAGPNSPSAFTPSFVWSSLMSLTVASQSAHMSVIIVLISASKAVPVIGAPFSSDKYVLL